MYVWSTHIHTYIPDAHQNKIQKKKKPTPNITFNFCCAFCPIQKSGNPRQLLLTTTITTNMCTLSHSASCIIIPTSKWCVYFYSMVVDFLQPTNSAACSKLFVVVCCLLPFPAASAHCTTVRVWMREQTKLRPTLKRPNCRRKLARSLRMGRNRNRIGNNNKVSGEERLSSQLDRAMAALCVCVCTVCTQCTCAGS